jgi:methylated-DNA-[protein]-cysteine S-methyltransferase
MENMTLYWSVLDLKDWKLHMAAGDRGLVFIGSHNGPFEELADWVNRRMPGWKLVRHDEKLASAADQIKAYLQGESERFNVPLDLHGTPFQLAVWNALLQIPYGHTQSYADIALRVGKPSAVRAVGAAIGANPLLIVVPCHRAIGKNGALTGYRGGLEMKKRLLQLEQQALPIR